MKNIYEDKVYYADTDSYGVVWHGTYLRWMEKGRVLFCDDLGLNLVELKKNNISIPVAKLNMKYKSPAKINEPYKVTTSVNKVTPLSVTFHQVITNTQTNLKYIDAEITVVAVSNDGTLYKKLPEKLKQYFNEEIVCND